MKAKKTSRLDAIKRLLYGHDKWLNLPISEKVDAGVEVFKNFGQCLLSCNSIDNIQTNQSRHSGHKHGGDALQALSLL